MTRDDLPKVTAPLLVFRSVDDHVVSRSRLSSSSSEVVADVTERVLDNSYHVATLDNDAPQIFAESAEFASRCSSRCRSRRCALTD